MIIKKDYNEIYLKGYEDGKNDNDNLKISYEIKPSFTTRKLKQLQKENKQLTEKLSKIETLIINHNCDTGDIYYKYNSRFLKSELKQRILEIVYEEGNDSDE